MLPFIIEPSPFIMEVSEMDMHSINVSWSQISPVPDSNMSQKFVLMISHGSQSYAVSLDNPYYILTAPEGAPCEVYNFSVTATYIGATYTGDECIVPSPVLNTTLPSLPDISRLNNSIKFSLVKLSGELTLNISFEVSCFINFIM